MRGGKVRAKEVDAVSGLCRAIALRAKSGAVVARDLAVLCDADSAARVLARTNNSGAAELRGAVDAAVAALESRRGGAVGSRLDSHHWDLGFLRVESEFEVLAVVDGDVLCRDEDGETMLRLIGRDEVRVEFGDGAPD